MGMSSSVNPAARPSRYIYPSVYTLPDWQANTERYHSPGCAVAPIAGLPKPRASGAPVLFDEALRTACEGVAGIKPAQLRSLLSRGYR